MHTICHFFYSFLIIYSSLWLHGKVFVKTKSILKIIATSIDSGCLIAELRKTESKVDDASCSQAMAMAAEPENDGQSPGPSKKARPSLFGHYKKACSVQETDCKKRERVLMQYIEAINDETFVADDDFPLYTSDTYVPLRMLFARVFCVPATSAPVERVFSQSGLIMRPNRAKMADSMLESLVFLKCNASL